MLVTWRVPSLKLTGGIWKYTPGKGGSYWKPISFRCYCWWTKSCTSWYDTYPIIYRVLYIPGGAGFLPQPYVSFREGTWNSCRTLLGFPDQGAFHGTYRWMLRDICNDRLIRRSPGGEGTRKFSLLYTPRNNQRMTAWKTPAWMKKMYISYWTYGDFPALLWMKMYTFSYWKYGDFPACSHVSS